MCSADFKETFSQTHHISTTVGDHTLGVTAEAVELCLKHGLTDDVTLNNVVTASLCHDLGIIGRDEKFRNNMQCLVWHPRHSAKRYKDMTKDPDERVVDSILCHMFPLKLRMPRYKEGWILALADKAEAIKEKLGKPVVDRQDREYIMERAGC